MKEHIRFVAARVFLWLKTLTGYVPPETVFKHLHFVGPFTIRFPSSREVTLYSWGDRVENELAWRGWDGHEPLERRCWAAMVESGGDILDIGANTATFALSAKCLAPASRVFAFEPVARIAEKAAQSIAASGLDVTVVQVAVGREGGELPIHDPGGENAYSASLDPGFLNVPKTSYKVPVTSLDEFCRQHHVYPKSIKLDVEGYEGEVIRGATEVLARGECVILCEWLGSPTSHMEARSILRRSGYIGLDVFDLSEIDLSGGQEHENRNIVLIHREKVVVFRKAMMSQAERHGRAALTAS
ncbi:FkbM family methyltransferase [Ancylobacter aquaticus]|uniref:FkbM family methyltransferase n=1 Tax=Ancylobacter aquaticus TaxID=100 RepID=A0A4V2PGH1_ANCAQ|nr:FkbM family methyltransferase [Ancylobacter aquaticus]TCK16756.1 FkbM family methyltransferase [Ancylobacter aquaticus]